MRGFGVRDSKDISDSRIKAIAGRIKKLGKDNYELIIINPKRYNELYDKLRNINEILNWSHTKAIENLLLRKNVKTIITDKFMKKDLLFSNKVATSKYTFIQEPKAEKFTAVAAASILAKDKQIQWFEAQKKSGINLKRGASEEVKNLAAQFLKNNSRSQLSEVAKMHFKTIKNLF